MSANDPAYVRLVDRLARGCQVDLESGWSIAGLDVLPFPDDDQPRQADFVRSALGRGVLEGCSRAEYEEVMEQDRDYLAAAGISIKPVELEGHYQESHVVAAAEAHRHALEAARGLSSGGVSYRDDTLRRKRIAQHAFELGQADEPKGDEDDDEGVPGGSTDDAGLESGASGDKPGENKTPAKKTAGKSKK